MALTKPQAKEIIRRILAYRILKAGNDISKKKRLSLELQLFEKAVKSTSSSTVSRGEFAELLLRSLRINTSKKTAVWMDEK